MRVRVQGQTRFVLANLWPLPPLWACCFVRQSVCVWLVRDWQTERDQGQAELVMSGKGPALLHKENTTWQMSVLSVFFFHEVLCCGLFRSPCHGKCSRNDGTTQTARLGQAAILNRYPLCLDHCQHVALWVFLCVSPQLLLKECIKEWRCTFISVITGPSLLCHGVREWGGPHVPYPTSWQVQGTSGSVRHSWSHFIPLSLSHSLLFNKHTYNKQAYSWV